MTTQIKFFHAGMGNFVCANRVVAMINPNTACGRRHLKAAKKDGSYIDCTASRPLKTIVLLEEGLVLGSAIRAKTLACRVNSIEESNALTGEDEDDGNELYEEDFDDDEAYEEENMEDENHEDD